MIDSNLEFDTEASIQLCKVDMEISFVSKTPIREGFTFNVWFDQERSIEV